jgi:hypothetical protein
LPESIGLSIARLIARRGNVIAIEGVDVLDGTPLLDIKPYVPDFDARENIRVGWFDFLIFQEYSMWAYLRLPFPNLWASGHNPGAKPLYQILEYERGRTQCKNLVKKHTGP